MSSQKNVSPNPASSKQRANMSTPTSSRRLPATNTTSSASSSASSSSSRRKPKPAGSRSPPAHSQSQPEFLSFQPALQGCYVDMPTPKSRRSPPRNMSNGNLSAKYAPVSPVKAPVSITALLRTPRASPTTASTPRNANATRTNKPFASAKYLELPMTANLPAPPADWLMGSEVAAAVVAAPEEELLIAEPPSPTTAAAVALATENGFDGRIRLSPLQLIAAVSAS